MRKMDILTIVMLTLLSLTKAQDSFHPDNVELHKIQRSLLQEYDEVSDGGEETNAIPAIPGPSLKHSGWSTKTERL